MAQAQVSRCRRVVHPCTPPPWNGASYPHAMSSSSLNPWGGATEPAHPHLKRIAPDGSSYTEKDFAEWYGPQYRHWWDLASPSDQEPQDHGAPTSPPNPTQSAGASSPAQKGGAQGGAAEHSLQAPSLTLQCPACKRVLCQTSDLAFVRRVKQNHGVEVHLMLKPENDILDTFKPTADGNTAIRQAPQTGTPKSWSCACGAKLGHTRPATVNRAHMTSFKSADVMLCGHHFTGKKSKWSAVYNTPPFDCIETRTRDTYFDLLV